MPENTHIHLNFQETAVQKATSIFETLDVNGDGELKEDEFVLGCLRNENMATLLNGSIV